MNKWILAGILLSAVCLQTLTLRALERPKLPSAFKKGQLIGQFRVANLYSDPDGRIVAIKLWHVPTGAPVFVLRIETVPQALTWIDTPVRSNDGVPHSLEHLLDSKGTKGRYFQLLRDMRLSQSSAATSLDFNYYGLASGSGLNGFFELLHAWLDALYRPDFSATEAEREFYHFAVTTDSKTKKKKLIEAGTVYDEMQTGQGSYAYYFELSKRALGEQNPFGFNSLGSPDEMRGVTSDEIRQFHAAHYRLGPTTGLIFALDPKEDLRLFLQRVTGELEPYSKSGHPVEPTGGGPKYPIDPSRSNETKIYSFPGANPADPGEIRFSWRAVRNESPTQLKLLELFFRALAHGERSVLYKSLVDSTTRELDSGATTVEFEPLLGNSPYFPICNVGISGVPGNRISVEKIDQIKQLILSKIQEVAEYPDNSDKLAKFNDLVMSYDKAWRRNESVWVKNSPDFSVRGADPTWKEYFDALEMNPSFNRSISEEPVWQAVEQQLTSTKNLWRGLIQRFRLTDAPYAAGSAPSARLLEDLEKQKEDRMTTETRRLMERYHTGDEQTALARFEQDEEKKTEQIDQIAAKIHRPRFTEHPPLTWDDEIRYRQFRLSDNVPVIATIFNRPPTIDIGLSFELNKIPPKYYRYLSVFPKCFDSLGLKTRDSVVPYAELMAEMRKTIYNFSTGYEFDAVSKRADFTIRASGADAEEFRRALLLIRRITQYNYLDLANADRLRDLVDQRLADDDSFTKQGEEYWISNPAYSFLHQDDLLFVALNSQFTRAHWDWRLKWLLHRPVDPAQIDRLRNFAADVLSASAGHSGAALSQELTKLKVNGLEKELVDYWLRNLLFFPESDQIEGLRQLGSEVQQDLRTGPMQTIEDLKELQRMILDRKALHVDLTISKAVLDEVGSDLTDLVESLPRAPILKKMNAPEASTLKPPMMARLEKRYGPSAAQFPRYVGLVNPDGATGNMIFYSDFPGYSSLDHKSLIQVLSSNLLSGLGPHSLHMKASEPGLAYSSSLTSDPKGKFIWYYADRVPDIPALIVILNSTAAKIPKLRDPDLVDYALRQTFSVPRSLYTPSQRGWALAADIRTGNPPDRIRRFSEAILTLRHDPDLLYELKNAGLTSITGVLLSHEHEEQQRATKSIFFFIGPKDRLVDAEKRLGIPRLLMLYPSDFWIEPPGDSTELK